MQHCSDVDAYLLSYVANPNSTNGAGSIVLMYVFTDSVLLAVRFT